MSAAADPQYALPMDAAPVVVVGVGPVGIHFTQKVLSHNSDCPIVLYGNEPWTPYDRVQLTALLAGETDLEQLANPINSDDCAIVTTHWNCPVISIDRDHHRLCDKRGHWQAYSKLVLAVGSNAVIPAVPGINLPGVFKLRDLSDVERLLARRCAVIIPLFSVADCSGLRQLEQCNVPIHGSRCCIAVPIC